MTPLANIILMLYHPARIARESLEYTLEMRPVHLDVHKQRAKLLQRLLDDQKFIDVLKKVGPQLDENKAPLWDKPTKGQGMLDLLKEFNDEIFIKNKAILERNGSYYGDDSMRLKLIEYVLNIHSFFSRVMVSTIAKAKQDNVVIDEVVIQLVEHEINHFQAISLLVCHYSFDKYLREVNAEIRRNGGNQTLPHINFMVNDMKKAAGLGLAVQKGYKSSLELTQKLADQFAEVISKDHIGKEGYAQEVQAFKEAAQTAVNETGRALQAAFAQVGDIAKKQIEAAEQQKAAPLN